MNRPQLIKFSKIPPVQIQKYTRYLPTAFDDTLTMLEKVNQVIHYLNEIGELTNEVVDKWNEVMEWVMNDGLGLAVIVQLERWIQDGTLDQIINEKILGSKSSIIVSPTEPEQATGTTFWFHVM